MGFSNRSVDPVHRNEPRQMFPYLSVHTAPTEAGSGKIPRNYYHSTEMKFPGVKRSLILQVALLLTHYQPRICTRLIVLEQHIERSDIQA
jgi:hypothetical protein